MEKSEAIYAGGGSPRDHVDIQIVWQVREL